MLHTLINEPPEPVNDAAQNFIELAFRHATTGIENNLGKSWKPAAWLAGFIVLNRGSAQTAFDLTSEQMALLQQVLDEVVNPIIAKATAKNQTLTGKLYAKLNAQ